MLRYDRLLRASRTVMGACALLAVGATPCFAQAAPPAAAPGYTPTMAEWMAVNDLMYRYRLGVEKGDHKALESAFWPDGENIAVPAPGVEIKMPLDGSPPSAPPPPGLAGPGPGAGGPLLAGGPPGGPGGPPPGGMGGPPPGGMGGPPPGGMGGPPGGPGGTPGGESEGSVWHMPFADTFQFLSPTRATHYQYFLSVYPLPEKTAATLQARDKRLSAVGWPGHYEDILEKRNGEWRILQRKSFINAK
ncbi:hypothetical protein WSK_0586 [Novosphingobium sp. Rr 2-17]|uniref:hypothetical protein n=1 Tax=Novosphingobium sp. Rr 2-17 TaxID=555793 RepID=UPI000269A4A4|nr:hypothetical protein [Novosphingobium sp. Rr 2-17]EIZ80903.1 hypothetical protein WSK_0586 [Novosphingobium sp. Rr 2-17]